MNEEIISQNNIKALEFRDKLLELCREYSCELSGSNQDDGNMCLEIYNKTNDWTSQYTMTDISNNYNLYTEDGNYNKVCIMDYIIYHMFNHESGEMMGLNNVKVSHGIITNDEIKATSKIHEIYLQFNKSEIRDFILSRERKEIRLNNGDRYIWIKPKDYNRGYRCGKIFLDRNITLEELHNVVMPMCYACGKDDVEIF